MLHLAWTPLPSEVETPRPNQHCPPPTEPRCDTPGRRAENNYQKIIVDALIKSTNLWQEVTGSRPWRCRPSAEVGPPRGRDWTARGHRRCSIRGGDRASSGTWWWRRRKGWGGSRTPHAAHTRSLMADTRWDRFGSNPAINVKNGASAACQHRVTMRLTKIARKRLAVRPSATSYSPRSLGRVKLFSSDVVNILKCKYWTFQYKKSAYTRVCYTGSRFTVRASCPGAHETFHDRQRSACCPQRAWCFPEPDETQLTLAETSSPFNTFQ